MKDVIRDLEDVVLICQVSGDYCLLLDADPFEKITGIFRKKLGKIWETLSEKFGNIFENIGEFFIYFRKMLKILAL